MKKLINLFTFLCCFLPDLFAQRNGDQISFKDVSLDLYLQIGFLVVYILLGLLFLLIFIFYPRQRLNLFFSLYNICLAIMTVNVAFSENSKGVIAENLISRLIGVNILLFILYALDQVKTFFWWFVPLILFIDFPLTIIFNKRYLFAGEIFHTAFTIVCFLLAVIAFRNKKTGNWLIGLIALAVVFINLRSLLLFFANIQLGPDAITGISPFVITVCALIYLALRYGRINTSLEQQLEQVQILSKKNLQTEKEKQQILAEQNEKLEQQVTKRTSELNNSITELKSTQAQLIQSEKMASLGELTAGIAHEIQNPLNFINNFSEVNNELIEELEQEAIKGNIEEVRALATDLRKNEQKINHHGKRADAIVKGMLQHSRASTGEKELIDINALADEYMRLSYQGLKAKNKNFKAAFKTDFDETIGKIKVVPQDIGRVLLNLYNNAFYAAPLPSKGGFQETTNNHEPTIWVKTSKLSPGPTDSSGRALGGGGVLISIRDNGPGIPPAILDKIFQPFFTTKPTGQGTGLGLSLSYDIIKAHGGELTVKTKEGEGAEFIIELPF